MASKVVDLLYWRDVLKTGVVFTGLVVGLASLFQLTVITVVSNLFLTTMTITLPVCLLYKTLHLVHLSAGEHPFQSYLDEDNSLTDEDTVRAAEDIVLLSATAFATIKRLVFVESLVDSVKFVMLMYLLTYVGVQANGLTLVIVGVICAFSLPLFYRLHQGRINKIMNAVTSLQKKITDLFQIVHDAVQSSSSSAPAPGPKSKLKNK